MACCFNHQLYACTAGASDAVWRIGGSRVGHLSELGCGREEVGERVMQPLGAAIHAMQRTGLAM